MIYVVSYATSEFKKSQKELAASALKHGADRVVSFNDTQLKKTKFYRENKKILTLPRGAGYWLWKPYYILETLKMLNDEDYLIYLDSGIRVIDNLQKLTHICKQNHHGLMLFTDFRHKIKKYTKMDCFYLMDCLDDKYKENYCLNAGVQVYMKNTFTINFIEEWLNYCKNEFVLTDIPNRYTTSNDVDFVDHRHDQSILSIMAIKYGLEIYRDPSQWGDYLKLPEYRTKRDHIEEGGYSQIPCENSRYPTLLDHHRKRNRTLGRYLRRFKSLFS